jgi:hypothetical protein
MSRLIAAVLLLVAACSVDETMLDSQSSALPLTKRQTAEIIFQAVCDQSTECQRRDSTGTPQPPVDPVAANSCKVELVRIYCGEETQSCNDDDLRANVICQPRDCEALTNTMLDEASACANEVRNANQCETTPACATVELYQ